MRRALILALVAGCGADEGLPRDAAGVRVTGCDDPGMWDAPALAQLELSANTGGGICSAAQYPLHHVYLAFERSADIPRVCWRVTEASPDSGWTAGHTFETTPADSHINLKGHARSITLEGRGLLEDGTVAVAIAPGTVELDPPRIAGTGTGVVTVMAKEAWAEADAVVLWGERIATDPVLDGAVVPLGPSSAPFTVHQTPSGLVHRSWSREGGRAVPAGDIALGPGTRARIARWGSAIVVDDELVLLGRQDNTIVVRERIALGGEPLGFVGNYHFVTAHVNGSLVNVRTSTGEMRTLSVGDGALLLSNGDSAPGFFDGTTFHRLDFQQPFGLKRWFTPGPADLAALGAPVAVMWDVIIGERGFLVALDDSAPDEGPRFVSFEDLFGEGRLGGVAGDSTAYSVTRADGTSTIYEVPFSDWCD